MAGSNYKIVAFVCVCLLINGCSILDTSVKPWQKEYLAKEEMGFDPDPLERAFSQHLFESKEGSSGGYGASAGGCGCN